MQRFREWGITGFTQFAETIIHSSFHLSGLRLDRICVRDKTLLQCFQSV